MAAHRVLEKFGRNGYFLFKQGQDAITRSCLTGYGPLGAELRRNFVSEWWYSTVTFMDGVYPIHSSELCKSSNSLSSIIQVMQSYSSSQKYSCPYGIAFINDKSFVEGDSINVSMMQEYCHLYYFVASHELEKWSVYWTRRRLKWWKQFSRYPERFCLLDSPVQMKVKHLCQQQELSHSVIKYCDGNVELDDVLEDILILPMEDSQYHCIITLLRIDQGLLTLVMDALRKRKIEQNSSSLLKLHLRLCPLRVAMLPKDQCEVQSSFSLNLSRELRLAGITSKAFYNGNLQSRLEFNDEIGTPFRVIVDQSTLSNGIIQLQDRNTGLMEPMESESLLMTIHGMYQRFKDDH